MYAGVPLQCGSPLTAACAALGAQYDAYRARFPETDEAYHDVIYHSTRNKRLVQILNNLREQMYRFRLEYIKDEDKRQILQLEHEKILAALRLRHMAEAKAVARGHIDNQEITVLKNLKERKEV